MGIINQLLIKISGQMLLVASVSQEFTMSAYIKAFKKAIIVIFFVFRDLCYRNHLSSRFATLVAYLSFAWITII